MDELFTGVVRGAVVGALCIDLAPHQLPRLVPLSRGHVGEPTWGFAELEEQVKHVILPTGKKKQELSYVPSSFPHIPDAKMPRRRTKTYTYKKR